MKDTSNNPKDPFGGYGPQPVRCRWLTTDDADRARTAKVVRLIVDEDRWSPHWANEVYQRAAMRDIAGFIDTTTAVVTTPAGMITTTVGWLAGSLAGVSVGRDAAAGALARLDFGPSVPETLIGVDGCVPGEATPLQCVLHVKHSGAILDERNTTMKLYPNNGESRSLVGWLAACDSDSVPPELTCARRIRTSAGDFLVLVCHDACLFSARSRANVADRIRLQIRKHFDQEANRSPPLDFVLIATHHQESRSSGGVFKNAAKTLAKETGATVITTMFCPSAGMATIAEHFPVQGERAGDIVTLLVADTLETS